AAERKRALESEEARRKDLAPAPAHDSLQPLPHPLPDLRAPGSPPPRVAVGPFVRASPAPASPEDAAGNGLPLVFPLAPEAHPRLRVHVGGREHRSPPLCHDAVEPGPCRSLMLLSGSGGGASPAPV